MVPVLSPHNALGVAVAEEIHDQTCGSSPVTAMARASRYFHFCGGSGNTIMVILSTMAEEHFTVMTQICQCIGPPFDNLSEKF